MSNDSKKPMWERSEIGRLFRWLFNRRRLRQLLILAGCLVAMLAVIHAIENWRGNRAWKKYRNQLVARGEKLDLKAFVPEPVPDEQNFAATPLVKEWFERRPDKQDPYGQANSKVSSLIKRKKNVRQPWDLAAWAKAFRIVQGGDTNISVADRSAAAGIVLEGLKDSEPKLEELRAVSMSLFARHLPALWLRVSIRINYWLGRQKRKQASRTPNAARCFHRAVCDHAKSLR